MPVRDLPAESLNLNSAVKMLAAAGSQLSLRFSQLLGINSANVKVTCQEVFVAYPAPAMTCHAQHPNW
jgi:hypothetical protein